MADQYQSYNENGYNNQFSHPPPQQNNFSSNSYGGQSDYGADVSRDRGLGRSNSAGGFSSGSNNKGGYNKGDMVTQEDTIFVSGMDPETTETEIYNHFASIGIIKKDKRTMKPKIWVYKDKESGKSKGEATITYDDMNAAQSAIPWFDGKVFNGAVIKVSLAQRTNNWQNKGGSGRGGGKGGFGGGGGGRGGGGGGGDKGGRDFGDRDRGGDERGGRGGNGGARGGGAAGTFGGQERDGDWICSDCSNKNFAWRNECNRCKTPKGDSGGSDSRPSGGFGGGRSGGGGGGGFNGNRNGSGGGRGDRGGGERFGGSRGGGRDFGGGGPQRGGDRNRDRQRPY